MPNQSALKGLTEKIWPTIKTQWQLFELPVVSTIGLLGVPDETLAI
jgi:hypothetical protein